jgi:hypothetical protein
VGRAVDHTQQQTPPGELALHETRGGSVLGGIGPLRIIAAVLVTMIVMCACLGRLADPVVPQGGLDGVR